MISPATLKIAAVAIYSAALFLAGWKVNGWRHDAELVREAQIVAKAQEGAAKAIAEIKVQNITIRQPLEREVRENTVYADCRNSPDGMRLLNATLLGPGAGKLPTIDPADGR